MENLVINSDDLRVEEIDVFSSKTRALLFDEENRVLIANYGGTYLLPGGKVDKDEMVVDALIRELHEETGISYREDELDYLMCLEHYQKDYPTRDGKVCNRLVKTYFFVGNYKEMDIDGIYLTENEKKGNFSLELIPYAQLKDVVSDDNGDNPRNIFFQNELFAVLDMYDSKNGDANKKLVK